MKKLVLPLIIAGLALASCKKTEEMKNENTRPEENVAETIRTDSAATLPVGDTTEISIDWDGTYTGMLPCESCPGIETTLTLNKDKTYTLEEKYMDQKDGRVSQKGSFTWSKDGSFVILNNARKDGMQKIFFVGESNVWMVEKVGDRSAKPEYKLMKSK